MFCSNLQHLPQSSHLPLRLWTQLPTSANSRCPTRGKKFSSPSGPPFSTLGEHLQSKRATPRNISLSYLALNAYNPNSQTPKFRDVDEPEHSQNLLALQLQNSVGIVRSYPSDTTQNLARSDKGFGPPSPRLQLHLGSYNSREPTQKPSEMSLRVPRDNADPSPCVKLVNETVRERTTAGLDAERQSA